MKTRDSFFSWLTAHKKIEAVLLDIDGTILRGHYALPGAREMLTVFDQKGIPWLLLTNDANHSHAEKSGFLKAAGFNISPQKIVSAGDGISRLIKKHNLEGKLFFALGDLGNPSYPEIYGLKLTRCPEEIGSTAGVIAGEGNYNWEVHINAALNYFIDHPRGLLIVPNPDSYWPARHGIGIGAGGVARLIVALADEYGVKIKPHYLGKPYKAIFHTALSVLAEQYGLRKKINLRHLVFAGDSLRSDMAGANKFGCRSALLLTGITSRAMLDHAPRICRPLLVFKNL
ncbi:MAG TPA: hypothetical protein DC049_07660 [Spirochaetia bacterium]|nr:hypothetical protein [Spirochaetia bacterium]